VEYQPTCKVCDRGVLTPKKIYRMSVPVVFIGYIFLIPSAVGVLFSVVLLIVSSQPDSSSRLGEGFAIFMGVTSFAGGLLGWLLIMKKRVLKCNVCRATVNAS